MRRFQMTAASRYIPKGAIKVADKKSDAVAYLYNTVRGEPGLRVFYGKQSKPVVAYYYTPRKDRTPEQQRTAAIANAFAIRQQSIARKAADREARKATGRGVEVGTLLYSSWGYDQTNIDYYEVTALVGSTMAEIRKVAATDVGTGNEPWMTGKSIPKAGAFIGEAKRVVVKAGRARIGGNYASVWDGTPKNWTSYA